jgi:curved DNA-binding protein
LDFKDYYKTLGVEKSASADEVQRAYRKLARKYHPDVNKDPKAEARFKEIGEAYEVLKDPEKRKRYDQFGSAWKQAQQRGGGAPPGWEHIDFDFGDLGGFGRGGGPGGVEFDLGGSGFSSFFDMLFGGGRPGGRGPGFAGNFRTAQSPRTRGGADIEAPLTLTLEEAARGGARELVLTDPATGERKTISVNVPKGLKAGQRIRLAGQGREGRGGGGRGDLYLKLELAPHPRFRLEGRDLHTTLPITPWEAALGGEARVSTLNGELTIRIPPGSSSGQKIRLRGKGYPLSPKAAEQGDLFAELEIVVPRELSDPERKLFEELAETSQFNPRGNPRGKPRAGG